MNKMDNRRRLVIYACEYIHTICGVEISTKKEINEWIHFRDFFDKNFTRFFFFLFVFLFLCVARNARNRYMHLHFIKRFKVPNWKGKRRENANCRTEPIMLNVMREKNVEQTKRKLESKKMKRNALCRDELNVFKFYSLQFASTSFRIGITCANWITFGN